MMRDKAFVAIRTPASKGGFDVIALKAGERPHFYEVKTTPTPFQSFAPSERQRLSALAAQAGAKPFLAHRPPHGAWTFYPESEWPENQ